MTAVWDRLAPATPAESLRPPPPLALLHNVDLAVAGVNKLRILVLLFLIVSAYTVISGLWGVLVTDFVQFWFAMAGCVALAFVAVDKLGGLDSTLRQMADIYSLDRARGMVLVDPQIVRQAIANNTVERMQEKEQRSSPVMSGSVGM